MLHLTVVSFFSYLDWFNLYDYLLSARVSFYVDNSTDSYNLVMPTEVYDDLKASQILDAYEGIKVSSFDLALSL